MTLNICFVSLPAYGYFKPEFHDDTGGGGAKRQIYLLTTHLAEAHDVAVIVGDYGQPSEEIIDGVSLIKSYTPNETDNLTALRKLWSAMQNVNADIYVFRGGPRKAAIVGALSQLNRKKFVYNIASDQDAKDYFDRCSSPIQYLFRSVIKRSHKVIAQTDTQQTIFDDRFGKCPVVVPNGYPPLAEGPCFQGDYFLWVGRIEKLQKQPHIYLELADRLPEEEFLMIGIEDDTEYSKSIIQRCRSKSNIEFGGRVSPDNIDKYYRDAISLVNTSSYEGFPNTFLESWRCGTPVVSLNVDTGRFISEVEFTGFCGGEFSTLVDRCRELACNKHLQKQAGQETLQNFRQKYQIDSVAERYAKTIS